MALRLFDAFRHINPNVCPTDPIMLRVKKYTLFQMQISLTTVLAKYFLFHLYDREHIHLNLTVSQYANTPRMEQSTFRL